MTLKTLLLLTLITLHGQAQILPNTNGISKELADYRHKTISQINYQLNLTIPQAKEQEITADETIIFQLTENTQPLYIDFKGTANQLQAVAANGQPIPIDYQNEHLIIQPAALRKGNNTIQINFIAGAAAVTRNPDFLYTFFVPERARTFFPCFDQPNLKATLTLTANAPIDWEVISNGPLLQKTTTANNAQFHFATSEAISTYLFSIVAGKFQKETRIVNNRQMNFYYRETNPEKIKESLDVIFDLHQKALTFMEGYTGIIYPFQKLDFIAIPDFQAGGMEHTGAIDYRASTLFLDKTASQSDKIDRIQLIAHETAHMWFGNLVTMQWFNDVWMKEVFANFMADKLTHQLEPDNPAAFQFLLDHYPAAYFVDRSTGSNPIRQTLDNLNQASSLYGGIIYDKAPIVMQQLETIVGAAAMQKALQTYLTTYAHSNADWNNLITILQSNTTEDLTTWNDNWINKAGRPKITYQLHQDQGNITQLSLNQQGENQTQGLWKQPFTIALVYDNETKILPVNMTGPSVEIATARGLKAPLYLLINASGTGYGNFPIDRNMLPYLATIKDPLMRASAYINLYENVLDGNTVLPTDLIELYAKNCATENEPLLLERLKRQFQNIYWQFLTPEQSEKASPTAEQNILSAIATATTTTKKRSLYQLYTRIAMSREAVANLYQYWETQIGPAALALTEDETTALAEELAFRNHPQYERIHATQQDRIANADRKARFQYLRTPLSNNVAVREAFFQSDILPLKNQEWLPTALAFLHHPLRATTSEKYITPTLQLLEKMQATGGVFFPQDCLSATLSSYQSQGAADQVQAFLQAHPNYNDNLKRKILQESDDLFRVRRIENSKKSK